MSIIKLHVCDLCTTDKVQNSAINTCWFEWREHEHYFNIDHIIHFKRHIPNTKLEKDFINIENFNTLLWIYGNEEPYKIKETVEQIIEIMRNKNAYKNKY